MSQWVTSGSSAGIVQLGRERTVCPRGGLRGACVSTALRAPGRRSSGHDTSLRAPVDSGRPIGCHPVARGPMAGQYRRLARRPPKHAGVVPDDHHVGPFDVSVDQGWGRCAARACASRDDVRESGCVCS
jgi:hypothetical protein